VVTTLIYSVCALTVPETEQTGAEPGSGPSGVWRPLLDTPYMSPGHSLPSGAAHAR
jgi:hypothetical protein